MAASPLHLIPRVLEYLTGLPEGTPVSAKELLHLGNRAAVDQALWRLAKRGQLLRVARGIYVRPTQGRFGTRAPSAGKVVQGLAAQQGEIVVRHGAAAANALGLSTQVPVRETYLTSGPSRELRLGQQTVSLRHALRWELLFPNHTAGEVVRALAWLGPSEAHTALPALRLRIPTAAWKELAAVRAQLPTWMAQEVSTLAA